MKKISVVEYVDNWSAGGKEAYVVNILKYIDKEKFDVKLLISQKNTDFFDSDLKVIGISIQTALNLVYENPIQRTVETIKAFSQRLSEIKCDIIHLHVDQGVSLIYACMAKQMGIKRVITHAHNSNFGSSHRFIKRVGHEVGKRIFYRSIDVKIACSDLAENWLYTKRVNKNHEVIILKYFVDVSKFMFNSSVRKQYRKENSVKEDEVVFLHVGRFNYQKNHQFLIDLFSEIHKEIKSKLFLIGEGELMDGIKEYVNKKGLQKDVIFVGQTNNVMKYMWMADIFLLPSLYEGNPIVVTEAQAAGLPCYISDRITEEAALLGSTQFIDISSIEKSKNKIMEGISQLVSDNDRIRSCDMVQKKGYDIAAQISFIEKIYKAGLNR